MMRHTRHRTRGTSSKKKDPALVEAAAAAATKDDHDDNTNTTNTNSDALVYAVRRGRYHLQNAVFLNWQDAQPFIADCHDHNNGDDSNNDHNDTIEYEALKSVDEAMAYLKRGNNINNDADAIHKNNTQETTTSRKRKRPEEEENDHHDNEEEHQDDDDDDEVPIAVLAAAQSNRNKKKRASPSSEQSSSSSSWQERYQQLQSIVDAFHKNNTNTNTRTKKQRRGRPSKTTNSTVGNPQPQQPQPQQLWQHLETILVEPTRRHTTQTQHHQKQPPNNTTNPTGLDANEIRALGAWWVQQRHQCARFLQGKTDTTLTKEQFQQLFALPGVVVDPAQLSLLLGNGGNAATATTTTTTTNSARRQPPEPRPTTVKQQQREQEWDACFDEFVQYQQQHGTGWIPTSKAQIDNTNNTNNHHHPPPPSPRLQKWATSVKNQYWRLRHKPALADGPSWMLTAARLQKLQDAGFVFAQVQRQQYLKFVEWKQRLQDFTNQNGHTRVPHDYPQDQALSNWVHKCRNEYRKYWANKEEEDRKKAAKTDSNDSNNNNKGNDDDDDTSGNQYRNKYSKKSALTMEQIKELEEMGFIWQVSKRVKPVFAADRKTWDERFEELVEFKKENGHTMVPQAYPKLGEWVKRQRKNYKYMKAGKKPKTPMTAEQAFQLQEIGFVFDVRQQQQRQAREHQALQVQQQQQQHRTMEDAKEDDGERRHSPSGGQPLPAGGGGDALQYPAAPALLHHHEQQQQQQQQQPHLLAGQIPGQNIPLLQLQTLVGQPQQAQQAFGQWQIM